MKKSEIKDAKISDLVQDDMNMNKHTEYGMRLLEKSISELGIGRSILVDRNNRIIGGNGVFETVSSLGLEDCIIVPTDGKKLVVVKREDIDLDSKEGRSLALADNSVPKSNIAWNQENIEQIQAEWNIDVESWGLAKFDDIPDETPKSKESKVHYWQIVVTANEKSEITELFNELRDRGFTCELSEKAADI